MNEAVAWAEKQRSYFLSGATRSRQFRQAQLQKLETLIRTHSGAILESLHRDMGKPAMEAYHSEVALSLNAIAHARKNLQSWMEPQKVKTTLLSFPSSAYIHPRPKGVCLIVAPWNYPALLIFSPLCGALAAGNTAILKPSEKTHHTAALLQKLFEQYFSPELVKLINGEGHEIIPPLLDNFRFDQIFFTGSKKVGIDIAARAAQKLSPVILELGGKSPAVVDQRTNLTVAARRIAMGKFFNAGQTCVAPDYVAVHHSVKEKFIQLLISCLREFYGDHPAQSASYARMVDGNQFRRLQGLLKGAQIIHGGEMREEERFFGPTLIDEPETSHPLMQEEIFGPILPIISWQHKDELLALLRRNPDPLAFYLFSRDRALRDFLLGHFSFGGGMINQTILHLENIHLPFGGIGQSGYGQYHGEYSFRAFSHLQSMVHASTRLDLKQKYPPYLKWVFRLSRKLSGRSV